MIFLLSLPLFAAPDIPSLHRPTNQSNTYIDWTASKLVTRVHNQDQSGQWNDERRQEQSALHEAEDLLRASYPEVPLSDQYQIRHFQVKNPTGVTLGEPKWHIDETIYYDEGSVEVIASIDLFENLNHLVGALASSDIEQQKPSEHTGLIVDARMINFDPILLPVIYAPDGSPLIHIAALSKSASNKRLPVKYAPDPAHPLIVRHVGKKAAVVRAISSDSKGFFIHPEDLSKLPSEADLSAIAASGLLAIIIDE